MLQYLSDDRRPGVAAASPCRPTNPMRSGRHRSAQRGRRGAETPSFRSKSSRKEGWWVAADEGAEEVDEVGVQAAALPTAGGVGRPWAGMPCSPYWAIEPAARVRRGRLRQTTKRQRLAPSANPHLLCVRALLDNVVRVPPSGRPVDRGRCDGARRSPAAGCRSAGEPRAVVCVPTAGLVPGRAVVRDRTPIADARLAGARHVLYPPALLVALRLLSGEHPRRLVLAYSAARR